MVSPNSLHEHLRDLIQIAVSDAHFAPAEIAVLYSVAGRNGITDADLRQLITTQATPPPTTPIDLVEAIDRLFDLASMVLADGVVEEDEMACLASFAERFGIPKELSRDFAGRLIDDVRSGMPKETLLASVRGQLAGGA